MWFEPLLHIIYAYMVTFTLFICLIQIQKRYVPYTVNQPKKTEILIFIRITQPYFEEMCISNILLDAPSCGLRREAKSFFFGSLNKIRVSCIQSDQIWFSTAENW